MAILEGSVRKEQKKMSSLTLNMCFRVHGAIAVVAKALSSGAGAIAGNGQEVGMQNEQNKLCDTLKTLGHVGRMA